MAKILIIDDEQNVCLYFSEVLKNQGHDVQYVLTCSDGGAATASTMFDVVFLDVCLPDGNGLALLSDIRGKTDAPEVIIMTGFGDREGAALAINNDAWDYIEKPASPEKLLLTLSRALQFRASKQARKKSRVLKLPGIVGGCSPGMEACFESIAKAADTDVNVLVTGETGSGKELVVKAIHENSMRSDKWLVVLDCASLPENLIESVLFGHYKGAFTGADKDRAGLIKMADKGTLFLDEVGELPLSMQKKFLRVLETRSFRPIGGRAEAHSDFRLVAATHRNLDDLVRKKLFREDLLYRLRSFEIRIPALREHMADIKDLSIHHMNVICDNNDVAPKTFDPEVFSALKSHDWPGNIRELFNVIDALFSSARHEPMIYPWHLPKYIRVKLTQSRIESNGKVKEALPNKGAPSSLPDWREFKRRNESQYIQNLLALSDWNISKASRLSGIGRTHLYAMIKKHGVIREVGDAASTGRQTA